MMNFENYVENRGKKIITIFIDLKREIKENVLFLMKTKNKYKSNTSDETLFIFIQNCNLFQKQNQIMFSNLLNVIFNKR